MARRYAELVTGLALCGLGVVLSLRADLGVSPWDVLHQGLAETLDLPFGAMNFAVGVVVLLIALAIGVRPGPGTVINIVVISAVEFALLGGGFLEGVPDSALAWRLVTLVAGLATLALGTALYIGPHLGAGPRDSLMVAIHQRGGISVGAARAIVEAAALVAGIVLGGPVGVGTVIFAIAIGPLVQAAFHLIGRQPARLPETTLEPG